MKKYKITDRGFSFVELIIVVAILALLIGLLTPQYLKYVERAKRIKDIDTAVKIRDAFDRVFATDNPEMIIGGKYYSGGGWDNAATMPVKGYEIWPNSDTFLNH